MSRISTPAIIVNFKIYREVEGPKAVAIARICQEVSEQVGVCIAVCPPAVELSVVASAVSIPVLAQHVDPVHAGAYTGWISPESVRSAGAVGTLVNHSEHRLPIVDMEAVVKSCSSLGLQTVVCADSAEAAGAYASLGPDFIAVEPPELIGGEVSVTSARPEVVEDAVTAVHRVNDRLPVLCGAGVKNGEDVRRAIELGTNGVLLASGVVKSSNVRNALADLVRYV